MVTVLALIVSEEPRSTTELAFACCGKQAGISFVNVSSWPKADKQWYLGVRCRRCHLPILFAVDRSGGIGKAQAPSAERLVLTCTQETCRHRADYTTTVVFRFQKEPFKPNETSDGEGKSRKRKH